MASQDSKAQRKQAQENKRVGARPAATDSNFDKKLDGPNRPST